MAGQAKIVVIGGGFGGLATVRGLKGAGAEITLVDQRNHHLFQPLLYQVATTSLGPAEIAWPIRQLLHDRKDVTTLMATVTGVDTGNKQVRLADGGALPYDMLVIATGARHSYFGHDDWEAHAPGLKTLEDATALRRKILSAFERAERTDDLAARQALLTFAIIGGGPTGVELAGAIIELARITLRGDFRRVRPEDARVVLIEAGPRVLPNFKPDMSAYAERALRELGVEVWLGRAVTDVDADGVTLGADRLASASVFWAAGVRASAAARWLEVTPDRAGRVQVEPTLTVPGHPDVFVIGDTAAIRNPDGTPVPGIGDAAKQAGRYVANAVRGRLAGLTIGTPFHYRHLGDIATIGRSRALVDFGRIRLTGGIGWWTWGLAHIYFLIGLKNRIFVALNWLWIYLTGYRGARLITQDSAVSALPAAAPSPEGTGDRPQRGSRAA